MSLRVTGPGPLNYLPFIVYNVDVVSPIHASVTGLILEGSFRVVGGGGSQVFSKHQNSPLGPLCFLRLRLFPVLVFNHHVFVMISPIVGVVINYLPMILFVSISWMLCPPPVPGNMLTCPTCDCKGISLSPQG